MTPEQLKASILQYAIQGKLTPQLESDGTAKSLLESCYTDVEIDGRRVKQKMIAEITDDEKAFDIPESWEWVKLGNVCTIARGGSPRPIKEYITTAGDGINWIKIGDTEKDGKYICSTAEKIKPSGASKSRMVHAGDFLLTNSMSFGRPYILKVDGCIHDGWLVISQTKEVFYQDYLYWMLSSQYAYFQFCNKVSGGVVKNLNSDKVANSVFPLPPLAEQKRIVAKIEELLPYVDRYAAAYEKLEQFNAKFPEDMKKSILQYAIQGKLVEQRPEEGTGEELYRQIQKEKQLLIKEGKLKKTRALPTIMDEEVPYDFPASWKVCYIDDIAFVTKLAGFEYTKYIADNLVPTGIPLFKGKNVQNGKLVLSFESYIPENVSDELPRSQITKKCLLTPYVGTIGNIAVFDGSFKAHLGSNVGKIELLNPDTQTFILEEYVLWYLKSTYGYAELTKYKKATAQESISIDAIRNVVIAIPPLEEQRRIVAKIEELLPYCDKLK